MADVYKMWFSHWASSMPLTTFVVDDSDPGIFYGGQWKDVPVHFPGSALPFNGSFKWTSLGNLSFSFTGSSIAAFGFHHGKNSTSGPYKCYVDGVPISSQDADPLLCRNDSLGGDGPHIFEIRSNEQNHSHISLDYLEFTSNSTPSHGYTIKILGNDPAITHDGNWSLLDVSSIQTNKTKSSVKITFNGTRLSWVGSIPPESPPKPVNGSYIIDGKHEKRFNVIPKPGLNWTFFTTRELPHKKHSVEVVYEGNSTLDSPLVLHHLYVDTTAVPLPAPPVPPYPDASASNAPVSPVSTIASTSRDDAGKIAGGVIGGVVSVLLLIALGLFFIRRRRRHADALQRQQRHSDTSVREREPLSRDQALTAVPKPVKASKSSRRKRGSANVSDGFGYSQATIEQTRAMRKGEEAARENRRGRTSDSHFTEPLPLYNTT